MNSVITKSYETFQTQLLAATACTLRDDIEHILRYTHYDKPDLSYNNNTFKPELFDYNVLREQIQEKCVS